MGTRGLFGFVYKGRHYVIYNHLDSYPSGLGMKLIKETIKAFKKDRFLSWKKLLSQIKIVEERDPSSVIEIEKFKHEKCLHLVDNYIKRLQFFKNFGTVPIEDVLQNIDYSKADDAYDMLSILSRIFYESSRIRIFV